MTGWSSESSRLEVHPLVIITCESLPSTTDSGTCADKMRYAPHWHRLTNLYAAAVATLTSAQRAVARWPSRTLPVWRRAPPSSPLPTPTLRPGRCYCLCSVNQTCARLETSAIASNKP